MHLRELRSGVIKQLVEDVLGLEQLLVGMVPACDMKEVCQRRDPPALLHHSKLSLRLQRNGSAFNSVSQFFS